MALFPSFFVFCVTIVCGVVAHPGPEEERAYHPEHCVPMTDDRVAEIQVIVDKISSFVDRLALEHEYFDISILNIALERHSQDEPEEKSVQVQVTVNDCPETIIINEDKSAIANTEANDSNSKNSESEDTNSENSGAQDSYSEPQNTNSKNSGAQDLNSGPQDTNSRSQDDYETQTSNSESPIADSRPENSDDENSSPENTSAQNCNENSSSISKRPEVYFLELDKTELELVERMQEKRGKNRPLVVYLKSNNEQIIFRK